MLASPSPLRLMAALAAVAVLLAPGPGCADDDLPLNRVSFSVERERAVENDRVAATASVTLEDEDPSRLADRINQTARWALDLAAKESGLTARTSGYHTYPVSDKTRGSVRHWRGAQTLVVEGSDATAVSRLLGRWQERLQLQGLHFSISPERRREVEDDLIADALDGFRARADLVRKKLGARSHQIVEISVDGQGGAPPPMRLQTMAAERSVTAPSLEGGTSDIIIRLHATIELTY